MKYRIKYNDMWGNPHKIEFEETDNDAAWASYLKWEKDNNVLGNFGFKNPTMERIVQEEQTEQVVGIVVNGIIR